MSPPPTPVSHWLDLDILRALLSTPSFHTVQLWLSLFFKASQLSYRTVATQRLCPSFCCPPSPFQAPAVAFSMHSFSLYVQIAISHQMYGTKVLNSHPSLRALTLLSQKHRFYYNRAQHLSFILRFVCLKTEDVKNIGDGEAASVTSKSPLFRSDVAFLL